MNESNHVFKKFDKKNGKFEIEINKISFSSNWKIIQKIYDGEYSNKKKIEFVNVIELNMINSTNINNILIKKCEVINNDYDFELLEDFCNTVSIILSIYTNPLKKTEKHALIVLKYSLFDSHIISIAEISEKITEMEEDMLIQYSLFVAFISIIHIIGVLQMTFELMRNKNNAYKYSLITLGIINVWDINMTYYHLKYTLIYDNDFQYFITPLFCYFTLSFVFELKLIIMVWRIRYYPEIQLNQSISYNIMFRFFIKYSKNNLFINKFLLVPLIILTTYLNMKLQEYRILFVIINLYLIPQIIHTGILGSPIKINNYFIYGLLLPRSLLIIYYNSNSNNFLNYEPNYFICSCSVLLILIQIVFIYLQDYLGYNFFIPRIWRKKNEIKLLELDSPPKIKIIEKCLYCLLENRFDTSLGSQEKIDPMVKTFCGHTFHLNCLKKSLFITKKMECPVCKMPISNF